MPFIRLKSVYFYNVFEKKNFIFSARELIYYDVK